MQIGSLHHRIHIKRSKNDDLPPNNFEADFSHKNHQQNFKHKISVLKLSDAV